MYIDLRISPKYVGRLLLCWGTEYNTKLPLRNAKQAYNKFKNHIIVEVRPNGTADIFLYCPQVYTSRVEKNDIPTTFPRHIHFSMSDATNTSWENTVYTLNIQCTINLKALHKMRKNREMVILNALPYSAYATNHIPGSQSLPVNIIKKMNKHALKKWFINIVKIHYVKLQHVNVQHIPIIVYCAHKKCNAATKLLIELQKRQFHNIWHYRGGMQEFFKLQKN
jgi:rhodanese-related sulfurtransferase